ncbi:hypothetical protein CHLRE_04g220200v5 [Chlamydomonas reinhardtii]|uniref:RCK N-terminal domain-containing protein n=1 Tax=Chlamydomonas reinhardtii TaxID=3055 RepID=A0A2K3DU71_CHLRE|nr:uncharacterized protein CHLRE_04g220200v5 [Chlamydomonas reinhardtii]PNW84079.1 hypothetical protein CHLRE_04g220200v5 [Chlamydomonas reinhardtii]
MASQLCQRPVAGAMAPGGLRRPAPQPRAWAPRLARPGQASAPALQLGSGMISSISNGSNAARRGMRVPTSTGSDSAAASSSPAPSGVVGALSTVDITEKLGNTNPLVQALNSSRSALTEAQRVREALEAEAQEVAQLAVEANEAKEKAKDQVYETVKAIESATAQQQGWLDKVSGLREKRDGLLTDRPKVEVGLEYDHYVATLAATETDLAAAEGTVSDLSSRLMSLKSTMEDMYAKALMAETAAAKAEEVAAAAMRAAETAVKDEMQAAAVVKETQVALEKTLAALKDLGDKKPDIGAAAAVAAAAAATSAEPAAAATVAAAAAGAAAAAVVGAKEVTPAAGAAGGAAAGAAGSAAPAAAAPQLVDPASLYPGKGEGGKPVNWVKLAAVAVGAAAGWYFFSHTAPGQAAVDAASGVMAMIKAQLGTIHLHEAERGLLETICLLFTSIVCVPLVVKGVPGGNAVLGYLLGGAIIGPYALGLISDVHSIKHLAEIGVVLLLFNIGLELSLDRLQSMAKLVFGMGTAQVVLTLLGVAGVAMLASGLPGPGAIILGGSLAMSSTAVAIQVLEERGEMGSRHGRAIFSVLLLQDLAVVVLLMLIPLLAPSPDGSSGGFARIAQALGLAAVKAVVAIVGIIAGGRLLVRPLYKKISEFANAEIFAATTLLMVLGTSFLTQLAGLSLALGAFLAGLLIAETEFALQVESDIAPYKGLLMGLFFMSVGMEISVQLFIAKWKEVLAAITILIVGKVAVMAAIGPMFGVPRLAAIRSGLLLAPGGEFAFVAFGEAVARGVLPAATCNLLYVVVALSMALTPYLAEFGSRLGAVMESSDLKELQPKEDEMKEMKDHVIIAGYGRVGQIIAQMLSEQLIPFVALDVSSARVSVGKKKDVPVFFGDAGSASVMHLVGAERAACAIIALDTPGANYRAVYTMSKHFPHVKTYVRAHDITNAVNLERAGATAVVPETLEPSLQLAAAVLREMDFNTEEVSSIVDEFRRKHLSDLQSNVLSAASGTSLGYGFEKQKEAGAGSSSGGGSSSSGAGKKSGGEGGAAGGDGAGAGALTPAAA